MSVVERVELHSLVSRAIALPGSLLVVAAHLQHRNYRRFDAFMFLSNYCEEAALYFYGASQVPNAFEEK